MSGEEFVEVLPSVSVRHALNRLGCHLIGAAATTVPDCVLGDPAGSGSVAVFGDSLAASLVGWSESLGPVSRLGRPSLYEGQLPIGPRPRGRER